MSRKTLAVVTNHSYSIEIYHHFLKPLFSDRIEIKKYPLDVISLENGIDADLILLSSFTLYREIKRHVLNDAEIIIADHTLMKQGIGFLISAP